MRPRYLPIVMIAAALALTGCSSPSDEFADKLTKAGFDHVSVEQDKQTKSGSTKKKKKKKSDVVAYDFDWKVSTDSDPATCEVELEHAANNSGLTGQGWYIDEVDGKDVTDSPASPNPAAVRDYLTSHKLDC